MLQIAGPQLLGSHVPEAPQGKLPPHEKQEQSITIYSVNPLGFREHVVQRHDMTLTKTDAFQCDLIFSIRV